MVVFTVFKPGLWMFRCFRTKRLVALGVAVTLAGAALLSDPGPVALPLVTAAGALMVLALVFNLNWLFPALYAVGVASVDGAPSRVRDLGAGANVLVVEIGGEQRAYPPGADGDTPIPRARRGGERAHRGDLLRDLRQRPHLPCRTPRTAAPVRGRRRVSPNLIMEDRHTRTRGRRRRARASTDRSRGRRWSCCRPCRCRGLAHGRRGR